MKLSREDTIFIATTGDAAARITGRPAGLRVESILRSGMTRVNETASKARSDQ
jgi:hypothetical protein